MNAFKNICQRIIAVKTSLLDRCGGAWLLHIIAMLERGIEYIYIYTSSKTYCHWMDDLTL